MSAAPTRFRHEAFVYAGEAGFLAGAVPFISGAVAAEEAILVAVPAPRIDLLREALGAAAGRVHFVDMAGIGANPARIIPLWQAFVDRYAAAGGLVWGIGEPVWAARGEAELAECYRHESLLNVAFTDGPAWTLLCPYDGAALGSEVIERALRTHPYVQHGADQRHSADYRPAEGLEPFQAALSEPPRDAVELPVSDATAPAIERLVRSQAALAGLRPGKIDDLLVAIHALADDSAESGRGSCTLRAWRGDDEVTCQVRDRGLIGDPLAGRRRPVAGHRDSQGLWLANQLCDLVELRSFPTGTVIRLHMSSAAPPSHPAAG